jgi:hypothetical protein
VQARRCAPPLLALALTLVAGCEIIDPGPEVGVAGRCAVDTPFFVERVVPDFLDQHDCASRGEGGCHDADNGNSIFRLHDTSDVLAPLPTDSLGAWPEPWQLNFEATSSQIVDCDNAVLAPLWSEPAGGKTLKHGGGEIFPQTGPELDLIEEWLRGS